MTSSLLAFIAITLFMIHEFEEIIRICPWIAKEGHNPKFAKEIFISGKEHYPSAETIAFMILEEFILASLILLAGILLGLPELVLAITLGHTFHLFSHIGQAVSYHIWVPGSMTAAATLPLLLLSIAIFFLSQQLNWFYLIFLTPIVFTLLTVNLLLLHKLSSKAERWLRS